MKNVIFRCLALAIVLGLTILLSASFGAREMRGQSRFPWPARTLSAQGLVSSQGPVSASSSPLWARSYGLFLGGPAFTDFEEDNPLGPLGVQWIGNGKFVVAGYADTRDQGGVRHETAVAMALSPSGEVKWKTLYPYDPAGSIWTAVNAITRTPDGGLLAVGRYNDNSIGPVLAYATVMDLDQDGNVCWMRGYRLGESYVEGDAVVRTRDGGYAVAGEGGYGAWVFKLGQSGAVIWSNVFRSQDLAYVNAIQETSDGGLVIAGNSGYGGWCQCETEWAWVIKLNDSGGLVWHTSLSSEPATDYNQTAVSSIVATSDGGVALAGFIGWFGSNSKAWACKLNSGGHVLWSKTYNGKEANSIIQTSDGDLLMTGGYPAKAFKLSPSGAVQWAKKYERSLKTMQMWGAFEKDDGGYIMVSNCDSINLTPDFSYQPWVVMSVDENGDIARGCRFVRSITGDARNVSVQVVSDSFSVVSLDCQVSTLTFAARTWPPVRVGHNVCSK